MDWIKVFAPATISNVGPGFDILGFAIEQPGDIVEARKSNEGGIRISEITGDDGKLPIDPGPNTAGIAAERVLKKLGVQDKGIEIKLHKRLPLGSGLGSSAASAVAAAYAVNLLFGNRLDKKDLLQPCLEAEQIVSGYHADNVAPCLLGGFTLIKSYDPLEVIELGSVNNLIAIALIPDFQILTRQAREILPKHVPFKDMISNTSNLASLIYGICQNDIELLGRSVVDKVIEPARASLIPGFDEIKQSALDAGAYGCSISGSGPAIFAITDTSHDVAGIVSKMKKVYDKHWSKTEVIISRVNVEGVSEI